MTAPSEIHRIERLRLLPARPRPHRDDTVDSYIQRLARANHLKPGYLRTYLCEPPAHRGRPRLGRLAAVSGRATCALRRVLTDLRCAHCEKPLPEPADSGRPARWCSPRTAGKQPTANVTKITASPGAGHSPSRNASGAGRSSSRAAPSAGAPGPAGTLTTANAAARPSATPPSAYASGAGRSSPKAAPSAGAPVPAGTPTTTNAAGPPAPPPNPGSPSRSGHLTA
jgi:hypothetical protein